MAFNAEQIDTFDSSIELECPGGKTYGQCLTAEALLKNSDGFVPDSHLTALDEIRHPYLLTYVAVGCVACHKVCNISLEMHRRQPTGSYQIVEQAP